MKSFLEENNLIGSIEMNLRDYFASKAMQAIIGKADERSTTVEEVQLWVGHYAYTVADAMIEARK